MDVPNAIGSSWDALPKAPAPHALGLAFAQSLQTILGDQDPLVLWTAYGLISDLEEGHGCWAVRDLGTRIPQLWRRAYEVAGEETLEMPDAQALGQRLRASPCVDEPGSDAPIIVEQGRLYLRKIYQAERWVATWFQTALARPCRPLPPQVASRLPELFSYSQDLRNDLQCIAAVNAWMAPVSLLAGGPGTGKTYTVVNYLALAVLASPTPPKILLLAPTGKAATRLAESVLGAKRRLELEDTVKAQIPDEGLTLHRALGLGGRGGPKHDRHRPLDADLIVVDESSMVDLVMMAQLLDAVPAHAKLLLVGDAHQLASVQAGTVFGDLCQGARRWQPSEAWTQRIEEAIAGQTQEAVAPALTLGDVRVHLQVSRRYDSEKGIGRLARAILDGDVDSCLALLHDPEETQLDVVLLPEEPSSSVMQAWAPLLGRCREGYASYWAAESPLQRMRATGDFQVLCATRSGHFGVEAANAEMWRNFMGHRARLGDGEGSKRAMTIMMTRNDYGTGLFNGDVGVIDRGSEGGLRAYFEKEGDDEGLFSLSVARIGGYEPAFAMTIHKSQGSEFDRVLVVLGAQGGSGLNRELLYTAITRAKEGVCIVASESVLRGCIAHRVHRRSGLGAKL